MVWVLIPMQVNHRNQLNERFPHRSKTSDGSIGDYQHTQEKSGHNPDDTAENNAEYDDNDGKQEVRAIDVDKDLNDTRGATMEDVIQHYLKIGRAGGYLPFRYFIYRRRIWRKSTGWKEEVYNGANPHDEHAHFSGDYTQTADNWSGNFRLDEVGDMALDTSDVNNIKAAVRDLLLNDTEVATKLASNATKGVLSYAGGGLPTGTSLPAGSNFLNHFTQNVLNVSSILAAVVTLVQGADVDEEALAAALSPMVIAAVVPAVVQAVGETAELTEAEVTEATEVAVRNVLGGLNDTPQG